MYYSANTTLCLSDVEVAPLEAEVGKCKVFIVFVSALTRIIVLLPSREPLVCSASSHELLPIRLLSLFLWR